MKNLFLFLVGAILSVTAFAQGGNYQDVVYLKNGSIIRGTIIEQVPNQSLKIETADGSLFAYKMEEVEKITKEKPGPAAIAAKQQNAKPEENLNYDFTGGRNMFASFGFGENLIGNAAFFGGKFEYGYYLNPQSILSVELGGGSYTDKEIGTFSYTRGGRNYTDGKISYDYSSFQFLASWSHVKDLSESVQWRIGPSLGLLSVSGAFAFDPSGLDGEPSRQSKSKSALAFGANTGFRLNFGTTKCWFLDLGYRLHGNTGISFDERVLEIENYQIPIEKKSFSNIGNEIILTVGLRFSKVYK